MGQRGMMAAERPNTITDAFLWYRPKMLPAGWLGHLEGDTGSPWGGGYGRDWAMGRDGEALMMSIIGAYTNHELTLAELVDMTALQDLQVLPLRVLALRQPWAWLVAFGMKRIETRTRATKFRGLVAIHASKTWGEREVKTCAMMAANGVPLAVPGRIAVDGAARLQHFGTGIVGLCRLHNCAPMSQFHVTNALSSRLGTDRARALWLGLFPDEAPPWFASAHGRWSWMMEDAVRFRDPVPFVGSLGLTRPAYRIGRGAPLHDAGREIAEALSTAVRMR
jgi:hypothetical protein